MTSLVFRMSLLAMLIPAVLGCDDFSHDSIVNTSPPNYVTLLGSGTAGGDREDSGYGVAAMTAGSYMVVGSTSSWGNGVHSLYLVGVGSSREILWTKFHGGWGLDHGEAMLPAGGGNYLIVGSTSSIDVATQRKVDPITHPTFDFEDQNLYLVKTNSEGITWWEKAIGDTARQERATSVVASGDGFLIAGVSVRGAEEDLILVQANTDGESVWQKNYPSTAVSRYTRVVAVTDGHFVLGGCGRYGDERGWDPHFMKVDGAGETVWQKTFGWPESHERVFSVTADGNGIAACGLSYQYAGTDSAAVLLYVIKVSPEGNLVWENAYSETSLNEGRAIVRKSDGSFIVCGQNNSLTGIDVCKIAVDGQLQWNDATGITGQARSMIATARGYAVAGYNYQPGLSGLTDVLFLEFAEDLTNVP